jgi:UDP-glucuronate 4-epimerase
MNPEKDEILVTGAAGFIGSNLVNELLLKGYKVVGIDNFNDYYNPKLKDRNLEYMLNNEKFNLRKGDIRDAEFLKKIFEIHNIKSVVHLAAMVGVRNSIENASLYMDVNVTGTTRVLERSMKGGVDNFILASSSSVYGARQNAPFNEEDLIRNICSPYAASKLATESIASVFHSLYNLPITCFRFFTVYGPRVRPDMAAFKFIDRISRGQVIQQYGDGSSSRDYTFVTDTVRCLIAAIKKPLDYEIINIGSGREITLTDFINTIEDILGKKAEIECLPKQPGDVPKTLADISKAQKIYGYTPSVSLYDGITKTIDWYNENY